MAKRIGLALVLAALFGILRRVELFSVDALHVDLAMVLIFAFGIAALARDWLLGVTALAVSIISYLIGSALPAAGQLAFFAAGAILAVPSFRVPRWC